MKVSRILTALVLAVVFGITGPVGIPLCFDDTSNA